MTTAGAIKREKGDLPPGTQIGRYRIQEPVGRGGMGTVYRAFDSTTNRNVALKLLAPGIPPSLRDRFLAECEAEANIRHEHVMPVYDRGWLTDERPYFVMELVYEPITLTELMDVINHGTLGSLHPRLRRWNQPRQLVEDVLLPIVEGIDVANNEYGIQHRDLKPDNILVDIRTKRAYLIDFGICRGMDDEKDLGRIVGTPRFLSPEQAAGRIDPRTDIWGLGAILHTMVTGAPPLAGTSPFSRADVKKRVAALGHAVEKAEAAGKEAEARGYARRRAQLQDPTLRVKEDLLRDAIDGVYLPLPESTSTGLTAILRKAMAKDPEDRYATAGDLARDLRAWVHGGGVQALQEASSRGAVVDFARRLLNKNVVRGLGALVAMLIGLLVGAGLFATTPPPPDHRAEDIVADALRVREARDALTDPSGAESSSPGLFSLLDRLLARRGTVLQQRARALPRPGTDRTGLPERATWAREVHITGWKSTSWETHNLLGLPTWAEEGFDQGGRGRLRTGLYQIRSAKHGVRLLMAVPYSRADGFGPRKGGGLERVVMLGAGSADVSGDMIWIPAGLDDLRGDAIVKPFLVSRDFVTNEKYSEWLDDLPSSERSDRVPPSGYVRDEHDPSRWLVAPGMGGRAVLGVKPEDAAAYAAWRGRVEGHATRLPTEREWRRMAAIDRMQDEGAGHLFPWRGAPQWKVRMRRGEARAITPEGRLVRGESPHGVRRLFAGPGEIVRKNDGAGFEAKGRGGLLPLPSAARRAEPLVPDAAGHGLGFRLVRSN